MRIYTLGTSHGDSTFSRFNSSTAYETKSGAIYLVDVGAPCEALLKRKGLRIQNLKAAFLTHMHDDHAGGLTSLIKQVRKYDSARETPFALFLPEKAAIEPLKNWVAALHESCEVVNFGVVEDGVIYDDENLRVTAIRTAHFGRKYGAENDPRSFAYDLYFKEDNKRVLHTGDIWFDFKDFPEVAQHEEFDACLCEATHYTPEVVALETWQNSKLKRLIFVHVGDCYHTHVNSAWNVDNGEKRLLDVCSSLPYPVSVAHDGDEFVF